MNLESLIVPLLLDNTDFKKKLEESAEQSKGIGGGLSAIGGGLVKAGIAGAVGAVGGLTAGIVASVGKTTEWAGELDSIQDVLGGTAEESAGLAVMMKRIGGSSDQITGAMAKMTMGLQGANGELGPTGLALQQLGISATDSNGNIKNAYDLFAEVSNVLAPMDDGLAKTGLMMDIFGKSGKDLGDALGAASNGGMAQFQVEAQNLGLALDPTAVIEMQKEQEKFNQTMDGLKVTVGSALIPVLGDLATKITESIPPDAKEKLAELSAKAGEFAGKIIDFIPIAIKWFGKLGDWLKENKPIIIGVLAALGVAIGYFVWTTTIPALIALGTTFLTAFGPALLVIAVVGVAVALLAKAWETDFGGMRTFLTDLWDNKLKPIFEKLKEWLTVDLPNGIKTLSGWWTDTLIPAIERVQTIFTNISDFINNTFVGAIDWLKTTFQNLGDSISSGLNSALFWLEDKLNAIGAFLDGFSLPWWLTPGSPSPFENSLVGVGQALDSLNKKSLPEFSANLNMNTSPIKNISQQSNGRDYQKSSTLSDSDLRKISRYVVEGFVKAQA